MSLTTWQQEEDLDPEQERANQAQERKLRSVRRPSGDYSILGSLPNWCLAICSAKSSIQSEER